ncbi:hypothetical protein OGY01_09570 [Citrobacter sp. Cm038]|uniref:hypothetical protein n=1 Tax=Citrobacter sp. Cm038 TaxID=2985117 RepID=UPI00257594D8|nr:hypothetical protein [Citrobacter sp. Cm038]MDM2942686.1 hypothetical protein [Citrobacter sp. Cm038]
MPISLNDLLKQNGPSLSSTLCDLLCEKTSLNRVTARKQISRATAAGTIKALNGLFPRRETFLYLPSQFGADYYWDALTNALQSVQSGYGYAIGALLARGGIIPVKHFAAACGSPDYMSKRLSHKAILEGLSKHGLIKRIPVAEMGECIALREADDARYDAASKYVKSRIITESILIKAASQWLKNLGMVSHDALRTREDAEAAVPAVSGFPFDLSAPCYLSPMLQQKRDGGILSGFLGCDVLLNGKLELNHITPFINKCRSINSLPNVGKSLFMFIADEYSKDAFQALKTQGIIPATVDNLFSQETAKALRMLGELLVWLSLPSASSSFELSTLEEIMTQLSHIAGATQQLQGDLFEYIVAQAVSASVRDVRLGVSCRLDDGKRADCDVLAQEGHKRIRFIECKGYRPYSEVLHKDVLHWITRQVPVFHKYACSIDPKIDIQVEFWTTGKLSEESLNSLKVFKDNNSLRRRYEIIIKDAHEVREYITLTRDSALIRVFEKHFIDTFKKEPLASKKSPWRFASGL